MDKRLFLCIAMAMLAVGCGKSPVSDGGGASETVATVFMRDDRLNVAVEREGSFTATVQVCSDLFTPVDTTFFHAAEVLTQEMPQWKVSPRVRGSFTVIIRSPADSTSCMLCFDTEVDMTKSRRLSRTGSLCGIVTMTDSGGIASPAGGVGVFIRGTFFRTVSDIRGEYRIDDIPEGTYAIGAHITKETMLKSNKKEIEPVVISGDMTVILPIVLNKE